MFDKKIKNSVESSVSEAVKEIKQEIKQEIKDSVEELCMQTIKEIFSKTSGRKYISNYFHIYDIATIGDEFKNRTIKAVGKDVGKKCTEAANDIVLGEEFIDSIVERIKSKQLDK